MAGVSNNNEVQLWQSFLEGDNSSLEKIYRAYFDELYQYGNKWLNDPAFTEDVIQELFIKLMRNRGNLAQVTSVKYYLFRSFKSVALDKLKSSKTVIRMDEYDERLFPVHVTPEHTLIEKEQDVAISNKLNAAIAQLTPRQREALFLRYNKGFSYAQVADMMQLTTKGTYKLMARAIEALKGAITSLVFCVSALRIVVQGFF